MYTHDHKIAYYYLAPFVSCSHQVEKGEYCEPRVHAACLGFTKASLEQLEAMPDFYCKVHAPAYRQKCTEAGLIEQGPPKKKKVSLLGVFKKAVSQGGASASTSSGGTRREQESGQEKRGPCRPKKKTLG